MKMVYYLLIKLDTSTTTRSLKNLIINTDHNAAIVLAHTSPKKVAQLAPRLLNSLEKSKRILGRIAGDDTILLHPLIA